MKKFGIIILSLIILMSGFVFALTPSPQVEVLSPNGGETFAIGNTIVINWDFDDLDINELPKEYTLGISLVDGPTPGQVTALNPIPKEGIYKWKISEHIFQGDAGMSLQPGKYKLELILYDGMPCLGYCPREYPQPNILSKDKSDDYFDIIKSGESEQLIIIPTEFSLEKGESAKVTNYQDMKIKLISISKAYVQCIKAPCPTNENVVVVGISIPGGCGTDRNNELPTVPRCLGPPSYYNEYTLWKGNNIDILDNVNLAVEDIESSKAEFKIDFIGTNTNNKPPVITSVGGPTDLKVNEMGKWGIEAYDPDGKYLKYSVDWGENIVYPGSSASNREISQEATFTHKYSSPGKYTVVFTVTDDKGGKVQSSISVNVGSILDKWEEFSLEKGGSKSFRKEGTEIEIKLQDIGNKPFPKHPSDPSGYFAEVEILSVGYKESEYVLGEIIVGFNYDVSLNDAKQLIKTKGLTLKKEPYTWKSNTNSSPSYILKWLLVKVPVGEEQKWIDLFKKESIVRYAELNRINYITENVEISSSSIGSPVGVGVESIRHIFYIGDEIEIFNNGRLKLIDIQTIKTYPAQYVAKFGIKFENQPIACSACMDGIPTGEYDEDGCMIFECPPSENRCSLKPKQGPCKARFTKYYFDQVSNGCKEFIWGGCEGVVPFDSLTECRNSCERSIIKECPTVFPISCEDINQKLVLYTDESGCEKYVCVSEEEQKECPQLGYREKGKYCNINNAWEEQLNGGEYCNNDFECSSNSCLDSQCTEPGFWIKLSEWLSKIFSLKAN